jgi:molybdate transport system regulatory protein
MAKLSIRIDLEGGGRVGPGKIRLLEAVAAHGSISAAGRELGMSYRRAWLLISELNALFRQPVVEASVGGKQGGGASVTDFGRTLIAAYRDMEQRSHAVCEEAMRALDAAVDG